MKVLVTGATGFIGSKIVLQLLEQGCQVITTSRSEVVSESYSWTGKTFHIPFEIGVDVQDDLYAFFQSPDVIFHMAWSDLGEYFADSHLEQQLPAHMAFLKNIVVHGAQNISVAGTCFEYGLQEGCLTEGLVSDPVIPYALAKDTLRRYLEMVQKKHQFNLSWFRYFYLCGVRSGRKSLMDLLDLAIECGDEIFDMSGGEQLRDYMSVDQAVTHSIVLSLLRRNIGIVNICSGIPISIRCLVEEWIVKRGASIKLNLGYYHYPDYEPMAFWGSCYKLKELED